MDAVTGEKIIRRMSAYNLFVKETYGPMAEKDKRQAGRTGECLKQATLQNIARMWSNLPEAKKMMYRTKAANTEAGPARRKKKSLQSQKRNLSAYNLFLRDQYKNRDQNQDILATGFNKKIGELWSSMGQQEKAPFELEATKLKNQALQQQRELNAAARAKEKTKLKHLQSQQRRFGSSSETSRGGAWTLPTAMDADHINAFPGGINEYMAKKFKEHRDHIGHQGWRLSSAPFDKVQYSAARAARNHGYMHELFARDFSDFSDVELPRLDTELATETLTLLQDVVQGHTSEIETMKTSFEERLRRISQESKTFGDEVARARTATVEESALARRLDLDASATEQEGSGCPRAVRVEESKKDQA
eukprot:m.9633 g.9633  ORF g.9633 m.9633 type:complete len:362 (+) comp7836_c0_seq1:143-1228(+)